MRGVKHDLVLSTAKLLGYTLRRDGRWTQVIDPHGIHVAMAGPLSVTARHLGKSAKGQICRSLIEDMREFHGVRMKCQIHK